MTDAVNFCDSSEKIFRAVKPKFLFKSSKNKISDTLFDLREGEKGVSFDRAMGRPDKESCEKLRQNFNNFKGLIISLKVSQCNEIDEILLKHTPSPRNEYHSEIFYQTTAQCELDRVKHILAEQSAIESY